MRTLLVIARTEEEMYTKINKFRSIKYNPLLTSIIAPPGKFKSISIPDYGWNLNKLFLLSKKYVINSFIENNEWHDDFDNNYTEMLKSFIAKEDNYTVFWICEYEGDE